MLGHQIIHLRYVHFIIDVLYYNIVGRKEQKRDGSKIKEIQEKRKEIKKKTLVNLGSATRNLGYQWAGLPSRN